MYRYFKICGVAYLLVLCDLFLISRFSYAQRIASHMGRKCKQKCITASVKFVATKSSCLCSEHFTADMFY